MQGFFFESPVTIGIFGVFLVGIAALAWTQTGLKSAMVSAIGLAGLTLVMLLINLGVQTDRENIRQILDDVAAAVRNNEHDKIYSYIHPNAVEALQRAKQELPLYDFEEARVTGVKSISVNHTTTPPTAIAEFYARIKVSRDSYQGVAARFVRVYFMQRDGRWLVRDYEHFEPTVGFRNSPKTEPDF